MSMGQFSGRYLGKEAESIPAFLFFVHGACSWHPLQSIPISCRDGSPRLIFPSLPGVFRLHGSFRRKNRIGRRLRSVKSQLQGSNVRPQIPSDFQLLHECRVPNQQSNFALKDDLKGFRAGVHSHQHSALQWSSWNATEYVCPFPSN